jgi:membrane protein YdbS with pleckstrin-like domain
MFCLGASRYNSAFALKGVRMPETIIRPTMKFIYLGYAAVVLVVVTLVIATTYVRWPWLPPSWQPWFPWLSAILLLWPLRLHFRNRLTKMTILDDKLRYETGLLSKTTRTILITRVQDVTVRQSFSQRIFGVGDLSMETAGGASGETIFNIDRPREIADLINHLSQGGHLKDQLVGQTSAAANANRDAEVTDKESDEK